MMISKPPMGSPCNNCGLCCRAELCPIGMEVFLQPAGTCPALEETADGSSVCGLIAHPEVYRMVRTLQMGPEAMAEAASFLIGSGFGCDARVASEPVNHEYERMLNEQRNPAKARHCLRIWGLHDMADAVED